MQSNQTLTWFYYGQSWIWVTAITVKPVMDWAPTATKLSDSLYCVLGQTSRCGGAVMRSEIVVTAAKPCMGRGGSPVLLRPRRSSAQCCCEVLDGHASPWEGRGNSAKSFQTQEVKWERF